MKVRFRKRRVKTYEVGAWELEQILNPYFSQMQTIGARLLEVTNILTKLDAALTVMLSPHPTAEAQSASTGSSETVPS